MTALKSASLRAIGAGEQSKVRSRGRTLRAELLALREAEAASGQAEPDSAEAAHEQALLRWRIVEKRGELLRDEKIRILPSGDERRVDALEYEVAKVELDRERAAAAQRLLEARARMQTGRAAAANAALADLEPRYRRVVEQVNVHCDRVACAYVDLLAETWLLRERLNQEHLLANRMIAAAKAAAPNDEVAKGIGDGLGLGIVPSRVDVDGVVREIDRPEILVLGADPRTESFWKCFADLAIGGRSTAGRHAGEGLLARFDRAMVRIKREIGVT